MRTVYGRLAASKLTKQQLQQQHQQCKLWQYKKKSKKQNKTKKQQKTTKNPQQPKPPPPPPPPPPTKPLEPEEKEFLATSACDDMNHIERCGGLKVDSVGCVLCKRRRIMSNIIMASTSRLSFVYIQPFFGYDTP